MTVGARITLVMMPKNSAKKNNLSLYGLIIGPVAFPYKNS